MPGRRPAAYLWSQAEHTEGLTGYLVRLLNGGTMAIDQDKLTEFLHKFVGDLGATMAAGNVLVGDRLGFYRVLTGQPMLPHELAERTGTAARYVDEWLRGQAAGGYVEYDPQTGAYSLTPEQAFALTDPDGAVFAPGAFELAPDGTWMVVEPQAGTSVTDNLNPVGRVYYSFSTFLCVPNALSQDGGYSLGAQAGEEPIRRLAADAGYTRFRRAAETPFNIVYEVRP